ncbi:MAG: hypothetical protein ACRCXZ_00895 [Patescibacteria group bacterium]
MKKFNNYVKVGLISLSILAIGLSTITGVVNSSANENEKELTNPETMLNVSFKESVNLENIIDNELNPDKNWQGMKFNDDFRITGLSGLSNFGGQKELVSINGQYSVRSAKRSYLNKYKDLIIKLDDIKNNGSKVENITDENQKILNTETSKMNGWELKRQRYWNWSSSEILNLSLIGSKNTLETIKEILNKSGHTNSIELTLTSVIQKEIEIIKSDLEGKNENEVNNYINDIQTKALKEQGIDDINKIGDSIPENIKNPIENVIEDTSTDSIETSISNFKLTPAAKAYNGWCGTRYRVWWTGGSIADCKDVWGQFAMAGYVFTILGFLKPFCYFSGVWCGVLAVSIGIAGFLLSQMSGKANDVANVCKSGRSKVTFNLYPLKIASADCD